MRTRRTLAAQTTGAAAETAEIMRGVYSKNAGCRYAFDAMIRRPGLIAILVLRKDCLQRRRRFTVRYRHERKLAVEKPEEQTTIIEFFTGICQNVLEKIKNANAPGAGALFPDRFQFSVLQPALRRLQGVQKNARAIQ